MVVRVMIMMRVTIKMTMRRKRMERKMLTDYDEDDFITEYINR